MKRAAWLAVCCALTLTRSWADGFSGDFDDHGLASLKLNGEELLEAGPPAIARILIGPAGALEPGGRDAEVEFDAATRTNTETFPWGVVKVRYLFESGRLELQVTIENTGDAPIADATLDILRFKTPRLPDNGRWRQKFEISVTNHDEIPWLVADWGDDGFVLASDSLDVPTRINFATPDDAGVRRIQVTNALWDSPEDPAIAPGEQRTYTLSLRPIPRRGKPDDAIQDLIAAFRKQYPRQLRWEDRRMIGMLVLASNAHRSPTNPAGWLNDITLDVRKEKEFRRRMFAQAREAIDNLKKARAQGMIFWSPEGERIPNLSYIGDPRLIAKLAPEFNRIADDFFALFAKAGLRTGVCLRPSRIDTEPSDERAWRHGHMGFDVAAEISAKVDYARKRWSCTLFYIDTNTHYFYRNDGSVEGRPFDVAILATLQQKYPDCLFIPEIPTTAYWAYSVPYQELREHAFGGHADTPDLVRRVWPEAFTLINPIDGPIKERRDDLIRSVASGNILLFRCWFNDTLNPDIIKIQRTGEQQRGRN